MPSRLHNDMEERHESVLFEECITNLAIQNTDIVVDATIGGAGHFSALLEKLGHQFSVVDDGLADVSGGELGRELRTPSPARRNL